MNMQFLRLSVLLAVFVGLTACSNSNNLKDPTNTTATVSSCDPTQAGCIQGQLTDDVVANLDYSCGNVRSVTDSKGFFTCPSNTEVTFFIGYPGTTNQLIIGSTTIVPKNVPVDSGGQSLTTSGIVEITPIDLAAGSSGGAAAVNNGLTLGDAQTSKVLNIIRFLKALDTDGNAWDATDYSGFNGNNRIYISDDIRSLAKSYLTESIKADTFAGANLTDPNDAVGKFIKQVYDLPGSHPGKDPNAPLQNNYLHSIPSEQTAQTQFTNYLKTSFAGVYFSSGTTCVYDPVTNESFYDLGMCNTTGDTAKLKSGDMMLFVDRTGYGYGFGISSTSKNIVAWDDTVAPQQGPAYPFYISKSAVTVTGQDSTQVKRPFDYITNKFVLGADADTSTTIQNVVYNNGPGGTLSWTGTLKAGSIASTPANYQIIYNGATVPDAKQLGVWTSSSPTQPSTNVTAGQFFLYNAKPANPYLDATTWNALATKFPLYLTLTFKVRDSSCTSSDTTNLDTFYCNTLNINNGTGKVSVAIMRNGNIITDLNNDCSALQSDSNDPDQDARNTTPRALVDASGQTEFRVGFVSTVTSDAKLSLTLMFPKLNDPLYNANFSKLTGTVGGVVSSALIQLPTSGANAFALKAADGAQWNNYFKSTLGLITPKSAAASSVTLPTDSQGLLLVSKSSCSTL